MQKYFCKCGEPADFEVVCGVRLCGERKFLRQVRQKICAKHFEEATVILDARKLE